MKNRLVPGFLCVIYLSVGVLAEDEIKRSTYPFMAFIYYQDETVLDPSGARFLQGAVLIRPTYLISTSPESTISKDPLSKTLLARLGATVIDSKFSLNEDEDEQEQEIIQITRPYRHNSTEWSVTDICLLKTLQPILPTKSVRATQLSTKLEPEDKVCHIIIFKKKRGIDVRLLTRMYVEMLPASVENCGDKFVKKTMACAADQTSAEEKESPSDFCHGNSGGPLICDNDVMGLQTYIDGDCSAPHLYQLLAPRKRFLDCGIDEKCDNLKDCHQVCSVIHKDSPSTTVPVTTEPAPPSVSSTVAETTQTTEQTTITESTTFCTSTVESTVSSTLVAPTITTVSKTITSWPNELDTLTKNEEIEAPARLANVEAQRQPVRQSPRAYSGANRNIFVFQSFIYHGFLLGVCLF